MAVTGIKKIVDSGKDFTVKNFADFTAFSKSVFSKERGVDFALGYNVKGKLLKSGVRATRIFSVLGALYVFGTDGELYVQKDGTFNKLKIPCFSVAPQIYPLTYDGKQSALIVSDGINYVVNDTVNYVGVPKCEHFLEYKNSLFFGYKRKIFVCQNKDYSGINTDFEKYITLSVPAKLGTVKRFIPFKNNLLAVCSRGFAEIKVTDDDLGFSFTPIDVDSVKIDDGSAVKIGNGVIFISGGTLCEYSNGSVREIPSQLDKNYFMQISPSAVKDDFYLACGVYCDGELGLYVYDRKRGTDTFIDFNGKILAEDGTIIDKDGNILELCVQGNADCEWQSISTDFDVADKKTVYQVYVNCSGNCEFTLTGDNKNRTFNLKAGGNTLNVNMYANRFSFNVRGNKSAFPVSAIKLKYGI